MSRIIRRNSSRGAALVEYVILIGLISIVTIGSVIGLGKSTVDMFETATTVLEDPEGTGETNTTTGEGDDIPDIGDIGGIDEGFPDLGGGDNERPEDPTGPFEVDDYGCLIDSNRDIVYCGEPELLEIPGEVTFDTVPEDVPNFGGMMCAYDIQNGSFYTRYLPIDGMLLHVCPFGEPEFVGACTIQTVDGKRFDRAWNGRSEAEVIADNDRYCEPDPFNPGGVRPIDGAWREDVSQ